MTEGDSDNPVEGNVDGGAVASVPLTESASLVQASVPAPVLAATPATNWLDQDPVLRDLWAQNLPPPVIAEKLNRSVAAIMTRAARLGLPRRFAPGRKSGQRYDMGETRRVARGANSSQLRTDNGSEKARPPEAIERICLMCMRKFLSAGRHNRICPTCKGSPEYIAGSSIPDISFGG